MIRFMHWSSLSIFDQIIATNRSHDNEIAKWWKNLNLFIWVKNMHTCWTLNNMNRYNGFGYKISYFHLYMFYKQLIYIVYIMYSTCNYKLYFCISNPFETWHVKFKTALKVINKSGTYNEQFENFLLPKIR